MSGRLGSGEVDLPTEELSREEWTTRQAAHLARVDALVAGHESRRAHARKHPVEDFLFVYYNYSPAKLRRWHPGPGVVLRDPADSPHADWTYYRVEADGSVRLDTAAFLDHRSRTVDFVRGLLGATLGRPAFTGCFGMHEWAMVYGLTPEQVRHTAYPLRLGASGTDEVVRGHPIRCSHFDAFRFFTPPALPRNALQPTRESQQELEQPGCLHAGMDVYKWAHKLAPLTPSELVVDAFALAREIRTLDMRASPYDLRDLGYSPLLIETAEGKSEYAARQREFARRSNQIRHRLLTVLDHPQECLPAPGSPSQA